MTVWLINISSWKLQKNFVGNDALDMTDQRANCVGWTKFGPKFVRTAEFVTFGMVPVNYHRHW